MEPSDSNDGKLVASPEPRPENPQNPTIGHFADAVPSSANESESVNQNKPKFDPAAIYPTPTDNISQQTPMNNQGSLQEKSFEVVEIP